MQKNTNPKVIEISPFLKWAGGKRWLVKNHLELLPKKFNTYYEPFLGSGAVFFALKPKKAVISDANPDLIATYLAIRDRPQEIEEKLKRHHRNHSYEYYYEERNKRRKCRFEKAAQFIYLNRTCWNGLYRVNLDGKFNVPIGTKNSVILESDNFEAIASRLRNKKIICSDFENVIDQSQEGDLVFIDPPYTVKHNYNGFIKYNEKIFTWEDQERLSSSLFRARDRGATILITNANHDSVKKLYRGFGESCTLERSSVLAPTAKHRGNYSELIIRTKEDN